MPSIDDFPTIDAEIAIEINESNKLNRLEVIVNSQSEGDKSFSVLFKIKFTGALYLNDSDNIGDYVKYKIEEYLRSSFEQALPAVDIVSTKSGSYFVNLFVMFSGASLFTFITKYGDIRSGAILIAKDIARVAMLIRPYLLERSNRNVATERARAAAAAAVHRHHGGTSG